MTDDVDAPPDACVLGFLRGHQHLDGRRRLGQRPRRRRGEQADARCDRVAPGRRRSSPGSMRPREYGAIHFHDDDLSDAGWEPSFAWTVPETCRAGSTPSTSPPATTRTTSRSPSSRRWAADREDRDPGPDLQLPRVRRTSRCSARPGSLLGRVGTTRRSRRTSTSSRPGFAASTTGHTTAAGLLLVLDCGRSSTCGRSTTCSSWTLGGTGSPHQLNADLHLDRLARGAADRVRRHHRPRAASRRRGAAPGLPRGRRPAAQRVLVEAMLDARGRPT